MKNKVLKYDVSQYATAADIPELIKRRLVKMIEAGKVSQNSVKEQLEIGGKCTVAKWVKRYGSGQERE